MLAVLRLVTDQEVHITHNTKVKNLCWGEEAPKNFGLHWPPVPRTGIHLSLQSRNYGPHLVLEPLRDLETGPHTAHGSVRPATQDHFRAALN